MPEKRSGFSTKFSLSLLPILLRHLTLSSTVIELPRIPARYPKMFVNSFYVFVAILVANLVFWPVYKHRTMPRKLIPVYDKLLFWFDTLGLAAFTVDGVMVGVNEGYANNFFLLIFLGFITGVGGGALRDIMANQMPDIFLKHIYACASLAGGITMTILYEITNSTQIAMISGFTVIVIMRYLAKRFNWNLPIAV